ncbi:hypothetical protein Csa_009476 [Cucumis sativus]|nr:hypothetical protein Csa_009476 [Cucumis sativus]
MLVPANSCHLWPSTPPTLLLLRHCETQNDVNQVHARIIKTGYLKNSSLTTKIILNSISSPHKPLVEFARYVFFTRYAVQRIRRNHLDDDPFLWNAVIKSYSHGNEPVRALVLFCMMLENGFCVDKFSFSLILKACARVCLVEEGKQIHGLLMKLEIGSNLFLLNCLIAMYLRCGDIEFARQVFDRMPIQDSVSYNSMIDGYVKSGTIDLARELFDSMPLEDKNLISWNSMLGGFAQTKDGIGQSNLSPDETTLVVALSAISQLGHVEKAARCSWIELEGVVHEFLVRDKSHPYVSEIYSVLDGFGASNLQVIDCKC